MSVRRCQVLPVLRQAIVGANYKCETATVAELDGLLMACVVLQQPRIGRVTSSFFLFKIAALTFNVPVHHRHAI